MENRRGRSGGRPRLNRARIAFRFALEEPALEELERQAANAGLKRSPYMEHVTYLAHGYQSPYLAPVIEPLPLRVDVVELQQYVDELTGESCGPGEGHPVLLRLDEAVGQRIYDWCDEHGVTYAGYMRSILRLAAGYRSADELRPGHIQGDLLGEIHYRGERARAS